MTQFADDDFVIDPDADVKLSVPAGLHGADGEAELVSVTGKVHTFTRDSKRYRSGDQLRWVDFAVAIDTPKGRVFVHTSPWKKVHTQTAAQTGSVVNKLFKQLNLVPTWGPADDAGNRPLATSVEGTKVLVTIADDHYTDQNGVEQTSQFITNIELR